MLSFWISALTLSSTLASSYAASIPTSTDDAFNITQRRDSPSYVQAAYFTNWGIYAANFQPTDIDPSQLTHILYAFADVSPGTGEISLTDSWADEEKHFPGDSWNEPGNNLYGCLKQLYLLKLSHRHLKVLLSVGGWTYSQDGDFSFLADSGLRASFVASAVQLIKDYGFDGIDIDFEYPENEAQGGGFLDLMRSLRDAFDQLAIENGDDTPYELTAAVAAGSQNYAYYPVEELDQAITYWNLMAYDYAGPWLSFADNQANLFGGLRTGVNTEAAINHYLSSGATPRKIVMGIPLYGRPFENTNGIGQQYNGVGPGTFETGVYFYKYLPLPGAEVFEDLVDVASYSYDPVTMELVSYDVPDIVRIKAEYVISNSLGGCMFWELSCDKSGSESLVWTAGVTFGQLDQTPNHVYYPDSKWDNIRDNMGTGSTAPPSPATSTSTVASPTIVVMTTSTKTTSTAPPSPTTSTSTVASPTIVVMTTSTTMTQATTSTSTSAPAPTPAPTPTSPYSCMCGDVAQWNTTAVYVGGNEAVYADHLWTAKWWTENDVPGGAAGVWVDDGSCD